ERFPLSPASSYPRLSVSAVVDANGVLYTVWQVSPGAGSEIHFQKRGLSGRPSPRDTTLESLGDGLQNPRIALDATGGIHVAYERSVSIGQEIRYKHWRPALGWDTRATQVSDASDVIAGASELLPTSQGNLDVTWIGYDGVSLRLRERARFFDGALVTAVPPLPRPPRTALVVGPNPLSAGQALEIRAQ